MFGLWLNSERIMYRQAKPMAIGVKVGNGKNVPWEYYLANSHSETEAKTLQALDRMNNS